MHLVNLFWYQINVSKRWTARTELRISRTESNQTLNIPNICVIGVIQMCSVKVYDPGNLTICYELTVCSFKIKHMYFNIYVIIYYYL